MKFRKGFRLLTLGWSDGNTFLPVNSCLVASSKESNLIDTAVSNGIAADYVLFDCWFANPAQITAISFTRTLCILMDALMASLRELLKLSEEQLSIFTTDFESRLSEYLRNAVHSQAIVA